jgi:hypothetical protein
MALKIGVLIIGSLYWGNDEREKWRARRLEIKNKCLVASPIRYGRCSQGSTFTMVFSNFCYQHGLGQALLVPCQNPVNSFEDLLLEACELSRAEKIDRKGENNILASWGAVGILPNPECRDELYISVLKQWNEEFRREAQKRGFIPPVAPTEKPVITADGLFDFAWPKPAIERSLDFDIILATATSPTLPPNYPTVDEIADAWIYNTDPDRREKYFFRNVENDIRTFQDEAIWQRMSQMKPAHLSKVC